MRKSYRIPRQFNNNQNNKQNYNVYIEKNIITRSIAIPINKIGKNVERHILNIISNDIEGKCITEGYVKKNSSKIITFSSGKLQDIYVVFEVVIECSICCPVEGMIIECIITDINNSGIEATSYTETPSPFVVFISRDFYYNDENFLNAKENEKILVKVISQRYELYDTMISIIGEIYNDIKKTPVNKLKITPNIQPAIEVDIPKEYKSNDENVENVENVGNPNIVVDDEDMDAKTMNDSDYKTAEEIKTTDEFKTADEIKPASNKLIESNNSINSSKKKKMIKVELPIDNLKFLKQKQKQQEQELEIKKSKPSKSKSSNTDEKAVKANAKANAKANVKAKIKNKNTLKLPDIDVLDDEDVEQIIDNDD